LPFILIKAKIQKSLSPLNRNAQVLYFRLVKPHFPNRYLTLALVGIILTAGVVSVLVFGLPWRISHQPKLLIQM
jgi:hypothetical protein